MTATPDTAPGVDTAASQALGSIAEATASGQRVDDDAWGPLAARFGAGPVSRLQRALDTERANTAALGTVEPGKAKGRNPRSIWHWYKGSEPHLAPDPIPGPIANLLLMIRDGEPWTDDSLTNLANVTGWTAARDIARSLAGAH